ncbi:Bacitracin transport ATP-binding protein BcrA [Dyadobacter sp. CECT 9275]|uniref:Bacitracin transport ATP-binding protein BcrA n=1 Tax=Dyadobacter helix TaxID=2822344 RepID=A0A916JAP2_9BACT|nr:ABC transporter ATP-binding protein [Dyadobacter sp. CECT 9275]CAG4997528.1 Bacitracin transport ATP-binding protein BcrA [Dyadobacter sp. CECT 9275]
MQNKKEYIIETSNLSFGYSKGQNILSDVNLKIAEGAIYGFLGPNGAGKTTSIRLILNLLTPVTGSVRLFGQQVARSSNSIFSKIGALIETPSLYEHLTGRDNLLITANIRNIPRSRVLQVLKTVGLSSDGERHVRKYSLGMKQRLGLAIALLPEPDLLILDEPTNGLDPNGMIEIRELLSSLSKEQGVTLLISSHLLTEIERLVSHVGILNHGKLLFQGSFKELQQIREEKAVIELDTNLNKQAISLLMENNYSVRQGKEYLEVKFLGIRDLSFITHLLVKAGLDIYRMQVIESSLEQIFLSFINQSEPS